MRRKKRTNRKSELPKTSALGAAVVVGASALGYMMWSGASQPVADEHGCFEGVEAPRTFVLADVSEPRWNTDQQRSIRRYLDGLFNELRFNERLSVFTTEGDAVADVLTPRFHVCGQASFPDELEGIVAAGGNPGYLARQKERLYYKVLAPQLDALLSLQPDSTRRQLHQSPVMEMVHSLSRDYGLRGQDRIVVLSDLIQNSDSARFCRAFNDMPPFDAFAKRRVFQSRLKPEDLGGASVDILMLQRYGYGQDGLEFCKSEDEIAAFWRDYFTASGAKAPNVIRIRLGHTG